MYCLLSEVVNIKSPTTPKIWAIILLLVRSTARVKAEFSFLVYDFLGEFDENALDILQRSPHVKIIFEDGFLFSIDV